MVVAAGHRRWWRAPLSGVYNELPTLDFSRAVRERADDELRVLAVPPCGWTDLGTSARVADCLRHVEACGLERPGPALNPAPIDLAEVTRAFRGCRSKDAERPLR